MNWIIIFLLVSVYLFETGVAVLNYKHSLKPLPTGVADIYDKERYRRWLHYSLDLHHFNLIERGFSLLLMVVFLLFVFPGLERLVAKIVAQPVFQSLLFLALYQLAVIVLTLPFRVYRTFVIEERHGFNRTSPQTFVKDLLLGLLLTLTLGGLILAAMNWLYLKFAANLWNFILVTWLALSFLMVFIMAFVSKWFLRLFNKFTPLPEGELRERIEDLAASLGFNVKAILVMDASKRSTKSNAAFTGIGRNKEVILFDTLIASMTDDEVLAVLAHELGHAVHKDIWRLLFQQIAMIGIYAAGIGLVLQSPGLFTSFGFKGVHFGFAVILFSLLFEPISLLLGIPLNNMSRKREFAADRFAGEKTKPSWLVSALKVLAQENLVNLNPHPLAVFLYYSHPPMKERIKALQG